MGFCWFQKQVPIFFIRLKVSKFMMLIADSLSIKNRTDIPYLQDAIIFI